MKLQNQDIITVVKLVLFITLLGFSGGVIAQSPVALALKNSHSALFYPQSVERFYKFNSNKLVWIAPDTTKTHTWDAMLLLDCVIQYGLIHADYHPKQLLYDKLHQAMEHPDEVSDEEKAGYDIFLTDALLCFINNLHYGRLNAEWPAYKIDQSKTPGFHAEAILLNALNQSDFRTAIISVQPKSKEYNSLQYQMYIATGLHTGDCYVTPESQIRLMAVNMERLRWVDENTKPIIRVNIPSNTLSLYTADTVYKFNVFGKSIADLPSSLTGFNVSKGSIVIHLPNRKLNLLPEDQKTLTDEVICIPYADKLAALLLHQKVNIHQNKFYKLQQPVALQTTYYTCEIKDGVLVTYKDVSNFDKQMEVALYRLK